MVMGLCHCLVGGCCPLPRATTGCCTCCIGPKTTCPAAEECCGPCPKYCCYCVVSRGSARCIIVVASTWCCCCFSRGMCYTALLRIRDSLVSLLLLLRSRLLLMFCFIK